MTDIANVVGNNNIWHQRASEIRPETRLFIDGQFVAAEGGATFDTVNPTNGTVIAAIAQGTRADVDLAVSAARKAFASGVWSRMAPRDRMAVLYRLADLIEQNAETFALLDSLDMGKPVADMLGYDVPQSVLTFRYLAEAIDKIEGAVTNTAHDALHMIVREPIGVVACIVPWNFPLMMAAWKVAPALATGNSVVLKPAEQSPLSALLLAQLFKDAGGPDGVFNVVNGYGEEVGAALGLHMGIDKIAFTGSTEVGKLMMVYSGQSNMKRVSTECGGKSPQIIMPDADLDAVIPYAVGGIFYNQGEVCSAGSRLLVHKTLVAEFTERFQDYARANVQVGDPLVEGVTMGPLVTATQAQQVRNYIKRGAEEGAKTAFTLEVPGELEGGNFVSPTLFGAVTPDMTIAREEVFGPVAALLSFETPEQAIQIANDTQYGLAASIWTRDLNTAHSMSRAVEAGIVWVNCYDHGDMTQPWGGYKQSGQGRDKCIEGMLAHTQTKSVWINLG
ncbi:aldehyde dehydrogenase [Sphingobium nicotianae]|uniref:Aldehyde dehydrogenase n=1 Tax=Sphingobium nicotianae TaxID=2782607 RepID=A0A9X1IPF4_9SPHN|nr:aldehyde dehydrogenase [Sphingobium nicotianae]MBT2186029.1 aldehyde dehydrogenase [Sphingobium nicotianae]